MWDIKKIAFIVLLKFMLIKSKGGSAFSKNKDSLQDSRIITRKQSVKNNPTRRTSGSED